MGFKGCIGWVGKKVCRANCQGDLFPKASVNVIRPVDTLTLGLGNMSPFAISFVCLTTGSTYKGTDLPLFGWESRYNWA